MIYSVYTKGLYKNEAMLCSVKRPFSSTHKQITAIWWYWLSVLSLNPQTHHRRRQCRQRFPPSAVLLESCQRVVCSVQHLPLAMLFPLRSRPLWVSTDPHFPKPSFFQSSRPALKDSSEKWEEGEKGEGRVAEGNKESLGSAARCFN